MNRDGEKARRWKRHGCIWESIREGERRNGEGWDEKKVRTDH